MAFSSPLTSPSGPSPSSLDPLAKNARLINIEYNRWCQEVRAGRELVEAIAEERNRILAAQERHLHSAQQQELCDGLGEVLRRMEGHAEAVGTLAERLRAAGELQRMKKDSSATVFPPESLSLCAETLAKGLRRQLEVSRWVLEELPLCPDQYRSAFFVTAWVQQPYLDAACERSMETIQQFIASKN